MIDFDTELRDAQETIDMVVGRKNGNAYSIYICAYEEHKEKHGSNRSLKNPGYTTAMNKRYDYVICRINEFIESRLSYDRKMEQMKIEDITNTMR